MNNSSSSSRGGSEPGMSKPKISIIGLDDEEAHMAIDSRTTGDSRSAASNDASSVRGGTTSISSLS